MSAIIEFLAGRIVNKYADYDLVISKYDKALIDEAILNIDPEYFTVFEDNNSTMSADNDVVGDVV